MTTTTSTAMMMTTTHDYILRESARALATLPLRLSFSVFLFSCSSFCAPSFLVLGILARCSESLVCY